MTILNGGDTTMTTNERTTVQIFVELVHHQNEVKRLQLELDVSRQLDELNAMREKTEAADFKAVVDEALAATKPPELHEVLKKESEVKQMGARIAGLQGSRDRHEREEAKLLYPEFHRLEEELKRMQRGLPAERIS
jgi:hypothetical protein